MVMPKDRYENLKDYITALEDENSKLSEKNTNLLRKNKMNTLRIRLIRTYLNTLSTDYTTYGGDTDLYDYATCKANTETINVINRIVSSVPDPKIANQDRWRLMSVFDNWKKPGVNSFRRRSRSHAK